MIYAYFFSALALVSMWAVLVIGPWCRVADVIDRSASILDADDAAALPEQATVGESQSRSAVSVRTEAPLNRLYRISSDDAWPLRGIDGMTFAERKASQAAQPGHDRPMADRKQGSQRRIESLRSDEAF